MGIIVVVSLKFCSEEDVWCWYRGFNEKTASLYRRSLLNTTKRNCVSHEPFSGLMNVSRGDEYPRKPLWLLKVSGELIILQIKSFNIRLQRRSL